MTTLDTWLTQALYEPLSIAGERNRLDGFNALSQLHYERCDKYRRIIDGFHGGEQVLSATSIETLPFLPVSLFKQVDMASIAKEDVKLTLTSSGTTGQQVSRILVDSETSMRQQKALASCMASVLGPRRLPMIVADTESIISNAALMSARGAGVLGMMRFGARPVFLADDSLNASMTPVRKFLEMHGDKPFFIFGFTFMVWRCLMQAFKNESLDLSNGILVHSGGWKQMLTEAVDNHTFRTRLHESFGLAHIYNFYGMVEQLGTLHMEGPDGLLYPPSFSSVVVRDPVSWQPQPDGQPGIIQVMSLVPKSYPGHSLLTEDMGVIKVSRTASGQPIRGLKVLGRVPKAELRGCSDVIATGVAI